MTDPEDWPTIAEGATAPTQTYIYPLTRSLAEMVKKDRMGEGYITFAQRGDMIFLLVNYPYFDEEEGVDMTAVNGIGAPIFRADESDLPPMLIGLMDQTAADVNARRQAEQ
jgi:hypothetical protein